MTYAILIAFTLLLAPIASVASIASERDISDGTEFPRRGLTDLEYWQATGLSVTYLRSTINTVDCHESESEFAGCWAALESLAQASASKASDPSLPPESPRRSPKEIWAEKRAKIEANHRAQVEAYRKSSNEGPKVDFDSLLENHWNALTTRFSEKPEVLPMIIGEAVNSYYSTAKDPHTRIMPYEQFVAATESSDEEYAGVGITLTTPEGKLVIDRPFESGPAEKAGLRFGDQITHIDHQSVLDMDPDRAVSLIRGPEGSQVHFRVLRKGRPLEFMAIREGIIVKNVTSRLSRERGVAIGYLRLNSFVDLRICHEVEREILALEKLGAQALILDLRGNTGGNFNLTVCVGGIFLGNQVVVQVKDLDHENEPLVPHSDSREAPLTALPMVTLINGESASSSEIIAGALQDHKRSWISGQRSFGKGTVQVGDFLGKKLIHFRTQRRFHQPSGRTNQLAGITPDFPVSPRPGATEEELFFLREEDRYLNSIPSEGEPWSQPRPEAVARIQKCLDQTETAQRRYEENLAALTYSDFQVLVAEDILACEIMERH